MNSTLSPHQKNSNPRQQRSPRSSSSFLSDIDPGKEIDLAVGLGAGAVSVRQIFKASQSQSRRHRRSRYVKAGIASLLSAGAFAMMAHDRSAEESRPKSQRAPTHTHAHTHQKSRSPSPSPPRHRYRLHSASTPELPRFERAKEYMPDEAAYYSDDESETSHPHGRRPRLPYPEDHRVGPEHGFDSVTQKPRNESRRRHSFGVFEGHDRDPSFHGARRRRSTRHSASFGRSESLDEAFWTTGSRLRHIIEKLANAEPQETYKHHRRAHDAYQDDHAEQPSLQHYLATVMAVAGVFGSGNVRQEDRAECEETEEKSVHARWQ
ncbi:hypothetical protein MKZ38_005141 [Zalerion maritima]|uniref:Uncharacterized protein n=1 Tax=Zalerion maritima TaxID=339359 RepID=A0AAD5RKR8_9PEZI|nr:hypothetical protein MKZ38_005141 [Zalerion maritima]